MCLVIPDNGWLLGFESHACPVFCFFPCFYYRAMHFSAERGLAIACRLSVSLSVCDVGDL